jgi:hypothetical protein
MRINVGFSLSHENFCVLFQFSFPTPLLFFFLFFSSDISTTLELSGCVWQWSGLDRSKKFLLKSIATFLLSILHQSFFYYYSNKKIITKQNFSLFCTKHSYFFFSHQSNMLQYWSTSPSPFLFPKSIPC